MECTGSYVFKHFQCTYQVSCRVSPLSWIFMSQLIHGKWIIYVKIYSWLASKKYLKEEVLGFDIYTMVKYFASCFNIAEIIVAFIWNDKVEYPIYIGVINSIGNWLYWRVELSVIEGSCLCFFNYSQDKFYTKIPTLIIEVLAILTMVPAGESSIISAFLFIHLFFFFFFGGGGGGGGMVWVAQWFYFI